MPRSAGRPVVVVSALLVVGGAGSMLVNATDANATAVTYECSAPNFGKHKVSLSGSLSTPASLGAQLPAALRANVTGTSLSTPEAIKSWSVTADLIVTGQGKSQQIRATGSGGAVPANTQFTGSASAWWTPAAAGTYSVQSGTVTFTAELVSSGTVIVTCSPQATVATTITVSA
jgi:hypothetical protein